jgi:AraC-like DNA-binding protein
MMKNNFNIPQSAPVKNIVHAFWQTDRPNTFPLKETIIPKGVVEIIFNLYEAREFRAHLNSYSFTTPKIFVQGFHTSPVQLYLNDRQTFFGVVLSPQAVKCLLGFLPVVFANCVTDLTLIDKSFRTLWHRLVEQKTFDQRVLLFTEWLKRRLPRLYPQDLAFDKFLSSQMFNELSVKEVAAYLCYSPRQLSRKMFQLTGLNTEQVLLFKKYLHAVQLIHYSRLSLTEISYACCFSDQSHFIKTFRSFTGITPGRYRLAKSDVQGHLFENVR